MKMMISYKSGIEKILILVVALLLPCGATAAGESGVVDFLRNTGKIYSVVTLVLIVFIGMIIFLIRLDKKLTKLENQINNE